MFTRLSKGEVAVSLPDPITYIFLCTYKNSAYYASFSISEALRANRETQNQTGWPLENFGLASIPCQDLGLALRERLGQLGLEIPQPDPENFDLRRQAVTALLAIPLSTIPTLFDTVERLREEHKDGREQAR